MDTGSRLSIVDSTLREGEQFARGRFRREDRLAIARGLDAFGVDCIEVTSPAASEVAFEDARAIVALALDATVVAHVRCQRRDIDAALSAGVDGLHLFLGTSPWLRDHSHGRCVDRIIAESSESIRHATASVPEVRFSCEDAFRTHSADVVRIAQAAEAAGACRVGLADTVGAATPREVTDLVSLVRRAVRCEIEFHGHNDGGCAVANAHAAAEAGATHIDTTILGIGERNGITALSGFIARMYLSDPSIADRYRLERLVGLDELVAGVLGLEIPFNACISGVTAFTHKAGLHAKGVLNEPRTYEALDPAVFGREREVMVGHTLTGRHAVAHRARQLGLLLSDEVIVAVTRTLKTRAHDEELSPELVDAMLRESVEGADV